MGVFCCCRCVSNHILIACALLLLISLLEALGHLNTTVCVLECPDVRHPTERHITTEDLTVENTGKKLCPLSQSWVQCLGYTDVSLTPTLSAPRAFLISSCNISPSVTNTAKPTWCRFLISSWSIHFHQRPLRCLSLTGRDRMLPECTSCFQTGKKWCSSKFQLIKSSSVVSLLQIFNP